MNSMLEAFKIKPFDLEPVLAGWTDGPVFKGSPKKDMPVEEWLEKIKAGCVQRNIPEEYWYKVGQHFMGPKAKARFEEVKKVIVTVNGGKYRWTWKKFKIAMTNMGWEIDANATETVKVRGGSWFSRKKSDENGEARKSAQSEASTSSSAAETSKRPPPSRSNTLRWMKKPLVEEPVGEETAPPAPRPKPARAKTVAESSFWSSGKETKSEEVSGKELCKVEKKQKPSRPKQQKARSETTLVSRSSKPNKEVSRSHTTDGHDNREVSPVVTGQAPVWLMNAVNALDFLTSEHPKAVSVVSAILITVGSIPALPGISAGAGGAILASSAAHAIGAIAVGLGQALGASAAKNSHERQNTS